MGVQAFQQIVGKAKLSNDADGERDGHPSGQAHRRASPVFRKPSGSIGVIQDDKQVNAFALPGGKVAVYTGILPVTKDENGLAAVLGHEIGHVVARHGGERMSQQMGVNAVGGDLGRALFQESAGRPEREPPCSAPGASVGVLLPWGRAQESEADHLGLILMAKAGYDPHAARDLWVRMANLSKGSGKPPEFLSTHPSEATRITQIEALDAGGDAVLQAALSRPLSQMR